MRWWRRLLPVFALAALLAMHGLDAESTEAHIADAPMSAAARVAGATIQPMADGHMAGHLAGVCVAMLLVGFAGAALRSLRTVRTRESAPPSVVVPLADLLGLGPPPPIPRFALAVIRR